VTGDEFRAIALSFPETTEKETWGDHTFRVRDKMFAVMGPDSDGGTIKTTMEEQQALIGSQPETYFLPDYVARYGWVGLHLATADAEEVAELMEGAWRRTASKKTVQAFDAAITKG
jgi:hypothetical protein